MKRQYFINLLFYNDRLNPIVDSEQGIWTRYKNNYKVNTNWQYNKYWDFSNNTMLLKRSGNHIRNKTDFIIDSDMFTLSFKYKIDKEWLFRALISNEKIQSFSWNNGLIQLLCYDALETPCISVKYKSEEYLIPIDYITKYGWNHFLMSLDKDHILRIFINGNKCKEKKLTAISYDFANIRFGNIEFKDIIKLEGPIIEYDELVLVNDCLYTDTFEVPKQHLHQLFPEIEIEEPEDVIEVKNIAAPFIFGSNKSKNDILHEYPITQRKDYKIDNLSLKKNNQIAKYKFDYDD